MLSTEARLEELLRRAQEEAAKLVTTARDTAAARESTFTAQLAEHVSQLERDVAGERSRREAELREAASQEAARFHAVQGEQVQALARYVVDRVIGAAP